MLEPKEEEQPWDCEGRPPGNHSASQEVFRQRFRQLCYQETPGPREALSQLRVLCCEWLRPERHSKEQIVELLVLEQFLAILPEQLRAWVRGRHPRSGEEAVTVLEDLEKALEPEPQVGRGIGSVAGATSATSRLDRGAAVGGVAKFRPGQVPGPARGPAQEEPWEKPPPLGATQETRDIPLQPTEPRLKCESRDPQPFPLSAQEYLHFPPVVIEDGAEPKDKGALLEPPSTEVESPASSETPATASLTSAFEATSQVEGALEQQQRNPKAGRPRQSPAQGASLRQMVVTHKKAPPGKKDHECNECGKAFIYNSHLVIHQRIHSGEKPYKCSDCGKTFNQSSNLIQHQRIHTGEKPYECSECGKAFRWGAHLVQHRRIHSGEKPYECKKCGRAFSQSSYLSQHLRIHSGEKPFVCQRCGKAYRWSSELIRHQRVHAGPAPAQSVQGERVSRKTSV
nr:zinc finger protein 232 isoform X1 [Oryctolagus cuniculus]XP_017204640.2 zinc finger protein 232 isoform X1 [Oryctolagus cuniculus]